MPSWFLPNGAQAYAYAYQNQTASTTTTVYPLWVATTATNSVTSPTATIWAGNSNIYWVSPAQQWERQNALVARAMERQMDQRIALEMVSREQRTLLRRQAESAKRRARDLLLEHLSEVQRETFLKHHWFVVEGGKSKIKYRIRANDSLVANVDVIDHINNRISHRLCAHLDLGSIPLGDHLLAQKMMLEYAEDDFLRIANRHAA